MTVPHDHHIQIHISRLYGLNIRVTYLDDIVVDIYDYILAMHNPYYVSYCLYYMCISITPDDIEKMIRRYPVIIHKYIDTITYDDRHIAIVCDDIHHIYFYIEYSNNRCKVKEYRDKVLLHKNIYPLFISKDIPLYIEGVPLEYIDYRDRSIRTDIDIVCIGRNE